MKRSKKDKKRVDLDVRPTLFWRNYDYGGPEEGESEVSPGKGFYNGKMDRYRSAREFIENSRARMRRKRKQLLATIYFSLLK